MFTVHFEMSEIVVLALLTGLVWHAIGIVAKTAALQFNAAVARKQDLACEAVKLELAKQRRQVLLDCEQIDARMEAKLKAKPAQEWSPKKDSIVFVDPSKTGVSN